MKKLFLLFFLVSCSSINLNKDEKKIEILDFDKDLKFDEFKKLLTRYNNISPYPDIDN
tara:strand:- start:330 stop:503 length:174 start_codon:yes stop_codon:yes gene_type:complete